MMLLHRVLLFIMAATVTVASAPALAKAKLMTRSEGVIVYSGPGKFYRPLSVLNEKVTLRAGSKAIETKDGRFYKVLVETGEKTRSIGFVSTDADVSLVDDSLGEDDLEKYGEVALIDHAAQLSYSSFRDNDKLIAIGYLKYLSPGYYVKGYAGQFLRSNETESTHASLLGAEIGNDGLLVGQVSGVVFYSAGLMLPGGDNKVFNGSSGVNMAMQAGVGLRYNIAGLASLSAGLTQAAFFNANNSFVTSGFIATIEVGL